MTNEDIAVQSTNKIHQFEQEMMNEFMLRVQQKTPVSSGHEADSHPGALKAGWTVSNDSDGSWTLNNSQDYAVYIEAGTHKMSPRGMIATTMVELDQIVDNAKKKVDL